MDHTMAKRPKRKHDDLDTVLHKISKLQPTSRRQDRKLTGSNNGLNVKKKVRTYDMAEPDPYLVGITAKSEGKDPIKAIEAISKPKTLAGRINKGIKDRKARQHVRVLAHEERLKAVREPKPLPALPAIMEPPLPVREAGDRPNVVALVYAFRSFQQFSSAHARRNLGNHDEDYYQGLKARLRKSFEELGIADDFDWSDFDLETKRTRRG